MSNEDGYWHADADDMRRRDDAHEIEQLQAEIERLRKRDARMIAALERVSKTIEQMEVLGDISEDVARHLSSVAMGGLVPSREELRQIPPSTPAINYDDEPGQPW